MDIQSQGRHSKIKQHRYTRSFKIRKIRYAVIGLGYIAQDAVLPAFAKAKKNSELVALISDNQTKLNSLSKKYKVPIAINYDEYDSLMSSDEIDAVYIALPNSMHLESTIAAAKNG